MKDLAKILKEDSLERYEDFMCLSCGEEMPTEKRTVTVSGGHYTGSYEVKRRFYDTYEDGWFVRLDNPEVLEETYKNKINQLQEEELESLKEVIESNISKEEFREMVFENKSNEIVKKCNSQIERFENFLHWFGKEFTINPQPRYAAHSSCIESLLEDEKLEKRKYFVKDGEEKILQANITVDLEEFTKVFKNFSQYFGLSNFKDILEDNLKLELEHFSDLYLSEILKRKPKPERLERLIS